MLIEFRVANHRSLRDEQVLTFAAGRVGDRDDPRPRAVPGFSEKLLTVAGLYGANASGKSNVLAALAFMRDAVLNSHRFWEPAGGVPREPFGWGGAAGAPSVFEVELLIAGVRYRYGFACDDARFTEEWLHAWPRGRKQVWYEREGQGDQEAIKFGEALGGGGRATNQLVERVTRPNALLLSAAVQLDQDALVPLYRWFAWLVSGGQPLPQRAQRRQSVPAGWRSFSVSARPSMAAVMAAMADDGVDAAGVRGLSAADLPALRALLVAADVGIVDMEVRDEGSAGRWSSGERVFLRHAAGDASGEAWLPPEEESHGTRALFRLAPELLRVLRGGGMLLVDELESGLHPQLALALVRQFNDPSLNPRNAQLLFTTHDTHLLGTTAADAALRRDQVWLTEKDAAGATALYPLTDYKPRKAENLERGYLQGRYGAVPFLHELVPASLEESAE